MTSFMEHAFETVESPVCIIPAGSIVRVRQVWGYEDSGSPGESFDVEMSVHQPSSIEDVAEGLAALYARECDERGQDPRDAYGLEFVTQEGNEFEFHLGT